MVNTRHSKTLTVRLPDGCEIVLTVLQAPGVGEAEFEAQVHRAENALRGLQESGLPHREPEPVSENTENPRPIIPIIPHSDKKLYVGNLPFAFTEEQLREVFAGQGSVLTTVIARFGNGGRSRGFGFVEMGSAAEALTAIEKLHEALAGDRKMVVRLARSKESRPEDASSPTSAPNADASRPAARGGRSGRRPSSRPARGPRPAARPDRSSRPARSTGISNNSGYEIYPRDPKGGFASEPTARSAAPTPDRIEDSPYMEDSGDIENRPPRSSRRRRR
jgi:RNA recognition motif-containing protein